MSGHHLPVALPATCLPLTPTYEAGVVVIVCLAVVLQDLPADVLCTLVERFVHAVGPGDRAFLFAVILLQERVERVGARPLSRGSSVLSSPLGLLNCCPLHWVSLLLLSLSPPLGSPSSLCPCPLLWGLPPPSVLVTTVTVPGLCEAQASQR